MAFNPNYEKFLKPNTREMQLGSLKLVQTFNRVNTNEEVDELRIHRVYEDKDGRKYVELFVEGKLQVFVSILFSVLEITPVVNYVDENGKPIQLSMFPIKEDFTYDLSGKVKGWAKFLLLGALLNDIDHYVEGDMTDTDFLSGLDTNNVNIFLANMLPFDYADSYDFMLHEREGGIMSQITDSINIFLYNLDRIFQVRNPKEIKKKKRFYLDIFIMAEGLLDKFDKTFSALSESDIQDMLHKSGAKSWKEIFPLVSEDFSTQDFIYNMKLKIGVLKLELTKKISE